MIEMQPEQKYGLLQTIAFNEKGQLCCSREICIACKIHVNFLYISRNDV